MAVNQLTIAITSDPTSAAAVRRLAIAAGTLFGVQVDVDYLALLTTELVTNAVRVDAGEVVTTFSLVPGALRVEVHDFGGGWPVMAHPGPLDENGGRGLLIVNALADAWGANADPENGTTVWFELAAVPHDGHGSSTDAPRVHSYGAPDGRR